MFDVIVLTAPSEEAACVYAAQLTLFRSVVTHAALRSAEYFTFADPTGIRIGSGGGTLHALLSTIEALGDASIERRKVLIVHSGGDARRSPMYSVCGKAWMGLEESEPIGVTALENLLLQLLPLGSISQPGSVVVACSDVLLSLPWIPSEPMSPFTEEGVYVASVPASVSTATNHGVLYNGELLRSLESGSTAQCLFLIATSYHQKPSVAKMEELGISYSSSHGKCAWIDTGVVLFTPAAAKALLSLQDSLLVSKSSSNRAIDNGYIRFELYSELLLACSTAASGSQSFSQFLVELGMDSNNTDTSTIQALHQLWTIFYAFPLHLMHFPNGTFKHLGTSREVFDLLMSNVDRSGSSVSGPYVHVNSMFETLAAKDNHHSIFCEHSILPGLDIDSSKGFYSHIVHPQLVRINSGSSTSPLSAKSWIIQEIPVRQFTEAPLFCQLALCIDDNTKAHYRSSSATVGGIHWNEVFTSLSISPDDIWDASVHDAERTLWTASVFPVYSVDPLSGATITAGTSQRLVTLSELLTASTEHRTSPTHLVDCWKSAHRLSLATLLRRGDAEAMFVWRLLVSASRQLPVSSTATLHDICSLADSELHRWRVLRGALSTTSPDICIQDCTALVLVLTCMERFVDMSSVDQIVHGLSMSWSKLPREVVNEVVQQWKRVYLTASQSTMTMTQADWQLTLRLSFLRQLLAAQDQMWRVIAVVLALLQKRLRPAEGPRLLLLLSQISQSCMLPRSSAMNAQAIQAILAHTLDHNTIVAAVCHHLLQVSLQAIVWTEDVVTSSCNNSGTNACGAGKDKDDGTAAVVMSVYVEEWASKLTQRQIELSLQANHAARHHRMNSSTSSVHAGASSPVIPTSSIADSADGVHSNRNAVAAVVGAGRRVVLSCAPVRIDLAGGWSDTPPICYDRGGSVLNVAIRVDGQCPTRAVVSFVSQPGLTVQCWKRKSPSTSVSGSVSVSADFEVFAEERVTTWMELRRLAQSESACALPKACAWLIFEQVRRYQQQQHHQLHPGKPMPTMGLCDWLTGLQADESIRGLLLMCISDVPAGSGMGGSSILAAVVLDALHVCCLGDMHDQKLSLMDHVYMVSQVEQLMTTGGGWQDQVGGIYPGFKVGRSRAGLPLQLSVEAVSTLPQSFNDLFNQRCVLIFTGHQRLAKNTLINALHKYSIISRSQHTSTSTGDHAGDDLIADLVHNAEAGFRMLQQHHPSDEINNDAESADETVFASLAEVLNKYWEHKIRMAPGSDPPHIRALLGRLDGLWQGLSLGGAGAGGFAILLLKPTTSIDALQAVIAEINADASLVGSLGDCLSLHRVEVDGVGMQTTVLHDDVEQLADLLCCPSLS